MRRNGQVTWQEVVEVLGVRTGQVHSAMNGAGANTLKPGCLAVFYNGCYGGFQMANITRKRIAELYKIKLDVKGKDDFDEEWFLYERQDNKPRCILGNALQTKRYTRTVNDQTFWIDADSREGVRQTNDPVVLEIVTQEETRDMEKRPTSCTRHKVFPVELEPSLTLREYDGLERVQPDQGLYIQYHFRMDPKYEQLAKQFDDLLRRAC